METSFARSGSDRDGRRKLRGNGFAIARALLSAGAQDCDYFDTERIHQRARELDPTGKDVIAIIGDLTAEEDSRRIVRRCV